MQPAVGSSLTAQTSPSPADGATGIPQAGQPVLPIIPIIPIVERPALADELIKAAPTQDFNLARDLTLFARVLRRAEGGRWVMAIFVTSTAVTIANMFGQVALNDWNGRFFDAVGRKDLSGFVHDLWTFLAIIAVLLALTVAQTFLQERLKFRLREWITRHLLVEWLNAVIFEMAARSMVFGSFRVRIDGMRLEGIALGERVDAARHQPAVEVKGASYAELKVGRDPEGLWIAQCIVDV